MKKIYFSRAQTRAMAAYEPIGDAFGGAAYGEKNDPVSAAVAIYTMAETYAIINTVAGGIMFAGAALSLAGNVTGNKNLQTIGTLAMVGGGIAGWVEPSLMTPSAANTTNMAPVNPTSGSENLTQSAVKDGALTTTPTAPVDSTVVTSEGAGLNTGFKADYTMPSGNLNINAPGAGGLNAPGAGGLNAPGSAGNYTLNSAGTKLGAPPPAAPGLLDKVASNPMGLYAAATTVGSVADWLSGKTDAEIDAMKAQTGYNNAKALETQELLDREKQRRANLNAGYQTVNTGINVNTNAQMPLPWQQQQQQPVAVTAPAAPVAPGLINGARPV